MSVDSNGYPWRDVGHDGLTKAERVKALKGGPSDFSPSAALAEVKTLLRDAMDNAGNKSELRMACGIWTAFLDIEERISW